MLRENDTDCDVQHIGRSSMLVSESVMMNCRTMMTYPNKIETYLQFSVARFMIKAFLSLDMVRAHCERWRRL